MKMNNQFLRTFLTFILVLTVSFPVIGQFDGFSEIGKSRREIIEIFNEKNSVYAIAEDEIGDDGGHTISIFMKQLPKATGVIRFSKSQDKCTSIVLIFPIVEGIIEKMKNNLDSKYKRTENYLDNVTWEVRPDVNCTVYIDEDLKKQNKYALLILPK